MSLADRLKLQIAHEGPITVSAFMTACLHDPVDGYYATRPKLGPGGDFITAPMVSQMFGELIGLWLLETWERLGRPRAIRLVEIGPGGGELMADALRAVSRAQDFLAAAELWLVEPSMPLRAVQAAQLTPPRLYGLMPHWVSGLVDVEEGAPILLVANEVLDCLPARQFVRLESGWAERRIGLNEAGDLIFGLAPMPGRFSPPAFIDTPLGAVFEVAPGQAALGSELGARIDKDGGAALLIDYGRDRPDFGDTLQALRRHQKVSPLVEPGTADLTVHADFPAVAAAAQAAGSETTPIVTQRALLQALGIVERAQALCAASLARGRPGQAEMIARQLSRLVDEDKMGSLFKALSIHQKGLSVPGFEGPP